MELSVGAILQIAGLVVGALFIVTAFFSSFYTVKQQRRAIIERFGKYVRTSRPGPHFKWPFIENIAGHPDLRVLQLDLKVQTKSQDNVFVDAHVSVQYSILEDHVEDAFYKLSDPVKQITSYVFDAVRAEVPNHTLDKVFDQKDEIALVVKNRLTAAMKIYGYEIVTALVTDIDPDAKVKAAMNEINAAQRLQVAATAKAEADKTLKVTNAQAEKESMELHGQGVAAQRAAIVQGLRESVEAFQHALPGATPSDAMELVALTQYMDMMKELGGKGNAKVILLPSGPAGLSDLRGQITQAFISANETQGVHPSAVTEGAKHDAHSSQQ